MKYNYTFILLIIVITLSAKSAKVKIENDKILHFLTSSYLTYWSYGVSHDILEKSNFDSKVFAVTFSLNSGLLKEISDKYLKKKKFSIKDLLFDSGGIITGLIIINNTR